MMSPRPIRAVTDVVTRTSVWFRRTRAGRAWTRYGSVQGDLLAGGIAYAALFSAFAALAVGWTSFMLVLGHQARLRSAVLSALADALPGLIDTGNGRGALRPDDLLRTPALSLSGLVAVVVLLLGAVSCLGALRTAVRLVFDLPDAGPIGGRVRELATFALIATLVLVSATTHVAVSAAARGVLGLLGAQSSPAGVLALRVVGALVVLAVDMATVIAVFVVLAGARPARKDLLLGGFLAAVAIAVVRQLGTLLVAGSTRNALLAPFAVVVTLLVWSNLFARITLIAAALTATPATPE
jgi:membrane protein